MNEEGAALQIIHHKSGKTVMKWQGVTLPLSPDYNLAWMWKRPDGLYDVDLSLVCRVSVVQSFQVEEEPHE